mmetsp:Transcript_11788/g.27311  ORF Transcript_11788/g.27311 Transcript_11788/m.27311 type:complete len:82 (-) Transcript_11788:89-334(-)
MTKFVGMMIVFILLSTISNAFVGTVRNRLVHEHSVNELPNRSDFVNDADRIMRELDRILEERRLRAERAYKKEQQENCIIS